ncbi:MAG: CBS domain-containing protein [Candidatus Odinarchaeota archaeon]
MMEENRETVINEVMTKLFFHLKPEDMINKAVHVFSENDIHSLLLVDDKRRIRGVVPAINVLSKMKETIKLKNAAASAPLLHENAKDFISIAKKMIGSDLNLLPVVDKHEKVLGVVSLRGLTRLLLETSPIQEADIEDYIEDIDLEEAARENDSMEKVISMMRKHNTTNLAVSDGQKIVGMIRAKELFSEWSQQNRVAGGQVATGGSSEKKAVGTIIGPLVLDPVVMILDETKLVKDAVDLMYEKNSDFLILEKEGKSKGKLTMQSLLRKMIEVDERSVTPSDLVRVDGAPDEEIALICVKKAQSLFLKFEAAFGTPRHAVVSFKKILYQSKRGMFTWEVTIKMGFDKRDFHASATNFGSRKTANVSFVKLGRTLRDYRSKLYDKYQQTTESRTSIPMEEGMTGTFPISVLGSPDTSYSSKIKEQLTAYLENIDMSLIGGTVTGITVEFEKIEESPDVEDIAWTCAVEIRFPAKSFSTTVMANDPEDAFKQAFETIMREIDLNVNL